MKTGIKRDTKSSRSSQARQGSAVVIAIAALVVISSLIAVQARRIVQDHRQLREDLAYQQTVNLCDAAEFHVRQSIRMNPQWAGETLVFPPGTIHKTNSGNVRISVNDNSWTITVRYPAQADRPYQLTRTGSITP